MARPTRLERCTEIHALKRTCCLGNVPLYWATTPGGGISRGRTRPLLLGIVFKRRGGVALPTPPTLLLTGGTISVSQREVETDDGHSPVRVPVDILALDDRSELDGLIDQSLVRERVDLSIRRGA